MPIPVQNLSRLQCEALRDKGNQLSGGEVSNKFGCLPSLSPATGEAALSAYHPLGLAQIMQPQRKSGMTGRTAAWLRVDQ